MQSVQNQIFHNSDFSALIRKKASNGKLPQFYAQTMHFLRSEMKYEQDDIHEALQFFSEGFLNSFIDYFKSEGFPFEADLLYSPANDSYSIRLVCLKSKCYLLISEKVGYSRGGNLNEGEVSFRKSKEGGSIGRMDKASQKNTLEPCFQ